MGGNPKITKDNTASFHIEHNCLFEIERLSSEKPRLFQAIKHHSIIFVAFRTAFAYIVELSLHIFCFLEYLIVLIAFSCIQGFLPEGCYLHRSK